MKKLFRTMLCAAVAAAPLCVSAFAADAVPAKQGDFYVEVNGEYVTFTDAVPKIKNDRSCLPFVAVFEQLGFAEKDMTWDGQTSTVTATKGDTTISLTIGQKQITLIQAGKTTVIDTDVAPYIEPSLSRTYVPFGLVADALGYKVGWDAKQGTVIIDDVDAILAANKETYTLMDKYMEYGRTFTEKDQQVKGSYSAYILTTSEMESSHGADKVTYSTNMFIDGTYAMTMAGSSQLQFTTDMTMDVETKWDGKDPGSANDNSEIGMELRGDLEKGTLYLQSPELASMMGQPGMANAWFKLDMSALMAQAGVNYTDLIRASLSAKDQNDVVVPLNQGGDTTKATFTKLVYDYTADVSEKASELRLTLRPLSSYRMDADMTVTVACGDWSQSITYDKDHKPSDRQTVAVPLKAGSAAAETITVTVSHKETGSIAGGLPADFVVCDDTLARQAVYLGGECL